METTQSTKEPKKMGILPLVIFTAGLIAVVIVYKVIWHYLHTR